MNELTIFKNAEFGSIRTFEQDGKVLFCGTDIAAALGYTNPRKAVRDHTRGGTKCSIPTTSGDQTMAFVPEGDVYRLIVHSKLPSAERFEKWVMEEVLPAIRKTGGYIAGQETLTDAELMAKALEVAHRTLAVREKQIEVMQPKALFADAVSASKTSILVGELAKLLKQNGIEIGQQRLFKWLRENGYLIRKNGSSWNLPTQRSMEQGLFEIKETSITHSDGHISISKTVKVTGKGQVFFVNKFLKSEDKNHGKNRI